MVLLLLLLLGVAGSGSSCHKVVVVAVVVVTMTLPLSLDLKQTLESILLAITQRIDDHVDWSMCDVATFIFAYRSETAARVMGGFEQTFFFGFGLSQRIIIHD